MVAYAYPWFLAVVTYTGDNWVTNPVSLWNSNVSLCHLDIDAIARPGNIWSCTGIRLYLTRLTPTLSAQRPCSPPGCAAGYRCRYTATMA